MILRNSVAVLVTVLSLVLAHTGAGAVIVVPGPQAASEGNYNNIYPFAIGVDGIPSQRYQQVYSSSAFTGLAPIVITGIWFRPDATLGSIFSYTLASARIDLSTTRRGPDSLDAIFANNIGADNMTVLPAGPLALSSSFTGPPGGPMNFDIQVAFATSFLYDPREGNLLLDVWNFGGGPDPGGLNAALDDEQIAGDLVSRVFSNTGVSASRGTTDTAGLVTQFEFEAVPEPATGGACFAILVGLLFVYRRIRG